MRHATLWAGLALGTLVSCETFPEDSTSLRIAAGAGATDLSVDVEGVGDGSDMDSLSQGSLRVEVARRPDYIDNVEVGLRLLGGVHNYSGSDQGLDLDLDTLDLGAAVVLRPYLDLSETVRIYGEGFGGYRHSWGDIEVNGVKEDGNDGGILFGAGGGLEFEVGASSRLMVGLEWSRNLLSDGGVDFDLDDFTAIIGWSMDF